MPRKRGGASEFIRSQPSSMPAARVVAKGAAQGLKFTPNLVYMVRSRESRGRPASRVSRKARKSRVTQRGQGIQSLIARLEEAEQALRAARSVLERLASFG